MTVWGWLCGGSKMLRLLITLAWRNLWRNTKRTLVTLSMITLGFSLATFFIGIGDGSHNAMIRNAISWGEGHITIQPVGYSLQPSNSKVIHKGRALEKALVAFDQEVQVVPRISLNVLANTSYYTSGANLLGINGAVDPRSRQITPFMKRGNWLEPGDRKGVVIGSDLGKRLQVSVGNKIVLTASHAEGQLQSHLVRVRGIFETPLLEINQYLIIADIALARQFLAVDFEHSAEEPVTRMALFLRQPHRLDGVLSRLRQTLHETLASGKASGVFADIEVLRWSQMMPELVQFVVVDDAGNYIFLLFILIMVVFGVVNTVLMSVLERTREFGLLRALGLSKRDLWLLVFLESCFLGLVAIGLGWVVSGVIYGWFSNVGLDFSSIVPEGASMMGTFLDTRVYAELSLFRCVQLTSILFITTLLSGFYPALRAATVPPISALRT